MLMKKLNRLWMAAALFVLSAAGLNAQVNPKPFVIPELKTWTGEEGQFVPTQSTRIVYPKGSAELEKIAKALQADYAELFGTRLEVAAGKGKAGDIVLALRKDKKLGAEGYRMSVGKNVVLDAPTPTGVYWATRTLLQISEQSENHALPCGDVRDWPDYAMRGFMIDCGRKFFPIEYLRDYVKMMSYYKMNTFHVHLNDNLPPRKRLLPRPDLARRPLHERGVPQPCAPRTGPLRRDHPRDRRARPLAGLLPLPPRGGE